MSEATYAGFKDFPSENKKVNNEVKQSMSDKEDSVKAPEENEEVEEETKENQVPEEKEEGVEETEITGELDPTEALKKVLKRC